MFITRKHLSRRTLLRGLGAGIALPLLDAMIPAATALANTAAAPKMRLGFIYFPHGAVMDKWTPTGEGSDFKLSPILEPLTPFQKTLTVISGLGNRPGESQATHAIVPATWLSCVHPKKGSQEPAGGVTADQIAALHIGQDTPLPSLEIAGEQAGGGAACDRDYGCTYSSTISFRTANTPLPMEHNPRKLFQRLFGAGDTPDERQAVMRQDSSLLDMVRADTADLRKTLGKHDQSVLDDYLDTVREIERRVQKKAAQDLSHLTLPEVPGGVPDSFDEQLDLMFDMLLLAWQTNLTRIANFMLAAEVSGQTYNNIGVPDAFHPLSHHGNDGGKLERLATVQNYHTQKTARFVKRLSETPDGENMMLDNTLLLYGSNMSNSDRHNQFPLPTALIGGACGKHKGGQHLRYPDHTPLANVLLTMLHRSDVPVETLGDSTSVLAEI
ncbi:MAG: DUF1552 domain-containing protein [Nevskiaceae bacterium]|jgi:hypothetical protein|nr:DUF1552 domain-containing protein [Nevskiaceae bacterium]